MTSTMIIRIGPLGDDAGNRLHVYAPLSDRISPDSVVFAASDEEGYSRVACELPGLAFACLPDQAEAAATIGAEPRPLSRAEAELAADIALGLKPIPGVPDPTDQAMRRHLFRALGDVLESPAWARIRAGDLLQGEVAGPIGNRRVEVGLTLAYRGDPCPMMMVSIAGTGNDTDGDVDLVLPDEPEYARIAIERAYGVPAVPRLVLATGPAGRDWNDLWLPVLVAALAHIARPDTDESEGPGGARYAALATRLDFVAI